MSHGKKKHVWLALKTAFAVAIVIGVARQFARILGQPELAGLPFALRIELLVPAGILYLLAHGCWGTYWVRLLKGQGLPVTWYAGLRAYYVSQFGKYVPGKVMVLLMRVGMLRRVGAHPLPVAITATYETLISMAAGALIGVLLLPQLGVLPVALSGKTAILFTLAAMPVVLAALNALAARIARMRRGPDARPLPAPSLFLVAQGLLHGTCGYCLLGLSLGLVVRAVVPNSHAMMKDFRGDLGAVAVSYVAGFVIFVAPGGLGVREWVLQVTLSPRFVEALGSPAADGLAVIIALILRLTWTIAEVAIAVTLYCIHPPDRSGD